MVILSVTAWTASDSSSKSNGVRGNWHPVRERGALGYYCVLRRKNLSGFFFLTFCHSSQHTCVYSLKLDSQLAELFHNSSNPSVKAVGSNKKSRRRCVLKSSFFSPLSSTTQSLTAWEGNLSQPPLPIMNRRSTFGMCDGGKKTINHHRCDLNLHV